ncbi:MAG TPA: hypothetical protein PL110_08600 [Candidatus Eremiobacteraeota bacterium]|nr:MAG: Glutathionylspermidine synthase [bacterium ADurb.Bin363]HPZ08160.1 hypothetical protein [Candidatus Eremiobacteraeota bacterium]
MKKVFELESTFKELIEWMQNNPDEVIKERQRSTEQLIKKRCVFGDTPFQTTLVPLFLKKESLDLIEKTSELFDSVIDKVVGLYFSHEHIRDYFPYHEVPQELVHAHPGYEKATILNRLDMLFDGKTLKYIEFNTDNPGGKGWVDMYEEVFSQQSFYRDIIADYSIREERKITKGLFNAAMNCFNEFAEEGEKPRCGFVTFREITMKQDDEIVRDFFIENGVEANIVDPRDLEFRDKRLYSNGIKFNLLIRSLKAHLYLRFPREMKDFKKSILHKGACMVNSFRALLGSEKSILSFLSNHFNHHYFTEEEVICIKAHIPWTRKLDETVTLSKEGEEISLKSYILKHKDELTLKPSWGAGGYNVMLGKSTGKSEWADCVEDNLGSSDWTVQEYIEVPEMEIPVIKNNKIVLEKKYFNLSPYVFGGKYVGTLGRVSEKDVINVSAGGGVMPVFPLKYDS